MSLSILKALALASMATAGAAQAKAEAAPVATPPAAATSAAKPAAEKRYCISADLTGTRMAKKVCHTRAEWKARGQDPLAPN